jgi:hypothetical protein
LDRPTTTGAWARALSIALLATLAYLPALGGGFVWDDRMLLLDGHALNEAPLWKIWFSTVAADYFPLTWTSFWLEWRLFGANPFPFHVTNLVLHAAAAILLWRVLLRLRIPGAWLGAVLFALHPVAVESVAWISERKNVLSAVFFLGAALAWIAADEAEEAEGTRRRLLALGLFVPALLAKPSVVMLPVVLVVISVLREGGDVGRGLVPRLRRHLVRAAPFFAASLAAGLVTIWFQWNNAMAGKPLDRTAPEKLGGAGWALASYVEKAFAPFRLGFVYADWPVRADSALFFLPVAVVALAAAVLAWLGRGRARPVALALGYHALMVLPVLGLLDMAYLRVGPVSNHLQYLALMGPAALVGFGVARLEEAWPRAARAGAVALVVALGASTLERTRAFESDLTLWGRAVLDAPQSAFARKELAKTLLGAGRTPEAIQSFRVFAALTRDPAEAHRALAVTALLEARWQDAVAEGARAHAISPDLTFQRDLARQLQRAGRPAEAAALLREAARP